MEKKPFPFDPFQDSLIGEKILGLWLSDHKSEKDLRERLEHSLGLGPNLIFFTPNADKQKLMVSYPTEIRKYLESKDYELVQKLLIQIARGYGDKQPALDISLELIEWLLTGFDLDELIKQVLSTIFEFPFDIEFVHRVRSEYIKELRG
ncbi:VanZ family protein [Leptospira sp. 96542]|nr:VanZ family protein [Leptospira sp. 96542]